MRMSASLLNAVKIACENSNIALFAGERAKLISRSPLYFHLFFSSAIPL
jgi:hypothetical protein